MTSLSIAEHESISNKIEGFLSKLKPKSSKNYKEFYQYYRFYQGQILVAKSMGLDKFDAVRFNIPKHRSSGETA